MKAPTLLLLCLVAASASAVGWNDLWLRPDQQGERLLRAGKPAAAAPLFADPRQRADAELKAGDYARAAQHLAPLQDAQSDYNRGNALAHTEDLKGALAAYDAALAQTPGDHDARHNRDLVARAMASQPPRDNQANPSAEQRHDPSQSGKEAPGDSSQPQSQSKSKSQPQSQSQSEKGTAEHTSSDGQAAPGQTPTPHAGQRPSAGRGDATSTVIEPQAQQGSAAQGQQSEQQEAAKEMAADARPDQSSKTGESRQGGTPRRADPAADAMPVTEQTLAMDQWLRRIPDDPGGLLRRKFLVEHLRKQQESRQ